MIHIRKSTPADFGAMFTIINDAARAYNGVIPADRWHEPYMSQDALEKEIADGVLFWAAEQHGRLSAVMGMQDKGESRWCAMCMETSVVLANERWMNAHTAAK